MRIHRLFEMVYLLMNRKTMTANKLAQHFEVSKRTILRDIEILSAADIPIYTTQGKGGGVSIMEEYVLNKSLLSEDDQNQIILALQGLSATRQMETDKLLGKLQNLFEKTDNDWIKVDFSRWGHGEADSQRFDLLKRSILRHTAITFDYVGSYGEQSERKVYPLKLVFKSKAWYLQAFCLNRQDYRTFKINRMLHLSETDEIFPAGQYAPPPIEDSGATVDSLVALELAFPAQVAYRVYDEFDEGAIEQDDNGWLRVFAKMPEDGWLYGFLLSFGKDVSVVAPERLKLHLEKLRT